MVGDVAWIFVALFGVSAVLAGPVEPPVNFTGYRLIQARFGSAQALELAHQLERSGRLQLWSDHPSEDGDALLLFSVAPEFAGEVASTLADDSHVTAVKVLEDDLQTLIDEERPDAAYYYSVNSAAPVSRRANLREFESYDQIVASIDHYASRPGVAGLVTRFVIGKSFEGRDIVGIRISSTAAGKTKPVVFVECGIHPREWASISTCLYMIDRLAMHQHDHKDLLDRFEFHFVPALNPDGYEYTRNVNRLWRKNRRPAQNAGLAKRCVGVDLNRNFDAGTHCGVGTSRDPCSDIFCGVERFSEPETKALRDYLTSIKDDVEYYVSLHSFGQLWMFPYSYTSANARHHDDLRARAKIGVDAIRAYNGAKYTYGPTSRVIYKVTGSSIDWAYDHLGINKSFVLELPPNFASEHTNRGFLLSPLQIIPVGIETLTGLEAMWLS